MEIHLFRHPLFIHAYMHTYMNLELSFVADCPCGDVFQLDVDDMYYGEDIATCDSCSLVIRVIYEEKDIPHIDDESYVEDEVEATNLEIDNENSISNGTEKEVGVKVCHENKLTKSDENNVVNDKSSHNKPIDNCLRL